MSKYATYTDDQYEELFSNYLIDSWSYSKLTSFSRNEKAFEMSYIYRHRMKTSATTIAGNAYHFALQNFFEGLKTGEEYDLPMLETIAFNYIDGRPAHIWKIQKTTPTVEECVLKATKTVTSLLANFMAETSVYLDQIEEIIEVEVYFDEFLTINGVDIPLPCHGRIDVVALLKTGKVAVIDHKSKMSFSDEKELKLSIGVQAITYVKGYESQSGVVVDEVWFVENKYSKNRNGAAQLNLFKIDINKDVTKLYEALLYEPLRRMVQAVADPDYVYLINDSDNFVDKAEIYDFWAKTMIAEIEEFNVDPSKKEMVAKRLKKIRDASVPIISPKVIRSFKENASEFIQYDLTNKNMSADEKIEHVLRTFGVIVQVAHKFDGYSSNTYLLDVSAGMKISMIHKHKLDVANALNVSSVRISKDLVVHDGRSYVGVEFSKKREKDLLFEASYLHDQKIPIGMDNFGNTIVWDLNNHSTPHMLICGATGSGKSVSIRSTVEYAKLAGVESVVIMDPKYEFLNSIKGVEVHSDIMDIESRMEVLVQEMNELVKSGKQRKTLIVFDEFADASSAARSGKALEIKEEVSDGFYAPKKMSGPMGDYMSDPIEKFKMKVVGHHKSLQENLKILLQKGRSVGFRIVSATQRASTKVITGDAKVNFPVQICFRVPKETDSRVVIDESGAESLAGMGDGLIRSPEYDDIVRFQAFYIPN